MSGAYGNIRSKDRGSRTSMGNSGVERLGNIGADDSLNENIRWYDGYNISCHSLCNYRADNCMHRGT